MADKTIGSLPNAESLTDYSSFVCEDSGVAKRVTGKQFKDFAKSGAVEAQLASEKAAEKALESEKAAKDYETAALESKNSAKDAAALADSYLQDIEEIFNGSPADPTNFEVAAGQSETYIGFIDVADPFVENGMAYRITVNGESVDVIASEETIVGLGVTIVGDGSSSFTVTNQNDYDVTGKYEIMANGVRYYSVIAQTNASISTKASERATDSQAAAAQSERNAKNSASKASTSETNAKASETAAKSSEEAAKSSENAASNSASSASSSALSAETSANTATQKSSEASISAKNAAASAAAAAASALQAETEAFVATYGETSYLDIADAVDNGKVVLLYNHYAPAVGDAVTWYVPLKRFVRTDNGDNYAEFSSFDAGEVTTFICTLHGYPSEWSTTVEKIGPKRVHIVLDSVLWKSNTKTQEVEAIGVDTTEEQQLLTPVPARGTQLLYDECGIQLVDYRENHVTFSCETVPEYDVHVYLLIQEVSA